MAGISVAVHFLKFSNKEGSATKDSNLSVTDGRCEQYTVHNGTNPAFAHFSTVTHSLFFLRGSSHQGSSWRLKKKRVICSRSDLHPSLAWTHSCTTQTQLSTWTQSSRPMSPIAVTRQRTPVKETHLAILLNKLLVQVVSPTSKLKTCPRTILRRYMVILE